MDSTDRRAMLWLAENHRQTWLDLLLWDPGPGDWKDWARCYGWED